jgi:hypothetical protein
MRPSRVLLYPHVNAAHAKVKLGDDYQSLTRGVMNNHSVIVSLGVWVNGTEKSEQ